MSGYELGRCREHGEVCAKRLPSEAEGGGGRLPPAYLCPGSPEDPVCMEPVEPLGQPCEPPPWAEYADEHAS